MYYLQHYVIDWEKVQTLEDIKRILKAVDIRFEVHNQSINEIKDLISLEDKKNATIHL